MAERQAGMAAVDPQALLVVLQNSLSQDQALRNGAETQLKGVASSNGGCAGATGPAPACTWRRPRSRCLSPRTSAGGRR